MSPDGDADTEIQNLRDRAERDRVELGETVQELAEKLDVKQQASRARAAVLESAVRWLRGHRPATTIAAAATATLLLLAFAWRRRHR